MCCVSDDRKASYSGRTSTQFQPLLMPHSPHRAGREATVRVSRMPPVVLAKTWSSDQVATTTNQQSENDDYQNRITVSFLRPLGQSLIPPVASWVPQTKCFQVLHSRNFALPCRGAFDSMTLIPFRMDGDDETTRAFGRISRSSGRNPRLRQRTISAKPLRFRITAGRILSGNSRNSPGNISR
jgi:hypothetical protein